MKDVSPDTCSADVANQRTDSLSLVVLMHHKKKREDPYPDTRESCTGSKTPIFGLDRTSSAQLQLGTRCARCGKVGHWA